jgi:class 3 adenylate cyclase
VIATANSNVERVFRALEVLSLTSTSFIKQASSERDDLYPDGFFTLPDAEVHLGNARQTSTATLVGYAPIVKNALEYTLWSSYSQDNIGWVDESYQTAVQLGYNITGIDSINTTATTTTTTASNFFNPNIWRLKKYHDSGDLIVINEETALACPTRGENGHDGQNHDNVAWERAVDEDPQDGPFSPVWTESPPPKPDEPSNINFNLMSDPIYRLATQVIAETKTTTFQDICQAASTWFDPQHALYSLVVTPAWNDHGDDAVVVGNFYATVPWDHYFENVLESHIDDPVLVVMESQCGGMAFSYLIEGANATLVSINEDVHVRSQQYEKMAHTATFATFNNQAEASPTLDQEKEEEVCSSTTFTITVYPTGQFEANYTSNEPLFYTLIVLSIFLFTILVFFLFDCLVQRRQSAIMNTAMRQNALVSSLFPKNIQKQLMEDIDADAVKNKTGKAGLRSYLNNEAAEVEEYHLEDGAKSKPIADLFPETTIMFADIAGFTAWSSTREPSAVFTLLEAIYAEFDAIAKRRRVFKVEVVGDCYVAVAGLPDPRPDHAVVMAKFANDCLTRMFRIVRKLEVELGPDTAELGLRVGMHSGPVVAGVLRGDKSRFQLFGDTVSDVAFDVEKN